MNFPVIMREIPEHWKKLLEAIPDSVPKTKVSNITIENVTARNEADYDGISRAFHIEGFEDQPVEHVIFKMYHWRAGSLG